MTERRRAGRPRAAAARARLATQVRARGRSASTAGWTRCRPSCSRRSCAGWSGWNEARRAAAARYDALLADLPEVRATRGRGRQRAGLAPLRRAGAASATRCCAALHAAGIGAGIHYPTPVHLTGAFRHVAGGPGAFPVAERLAGEILSLPLYPEISPASRSGSSTRCGGPCDDGR